MVNVILGPFAPRTALPRSIGTVCPLWISIVGEKTVISGPILVTLPATRNLKGFSTLPSLLPSLLANEINSAPDQTLSVLSVTLKVVDTPGARLVEPGWLTVKCLVSTNELGSKTNG